MKKTVTKTRTTPAQITPADAIAARFSAHETYVFSALIPLAGVELPALIAGGFDSVAADLTLARMKAEAGQAQ